MLDRLGLGRPGARCLIVGGLLMLSACGPVSTTLVLQDAETALEGARGAGADHFAAFEFVSAEEYLRKAREEEGYSDFQVAITLATQARKFAEAAHERALKNPSRGTLPPAAVEDAPDGPDAPVPSETHESGSQL